MGYFNFFTSEADNEYKIVNDATDEFIEMYGIPVNYLPRTAVAEDSLFGEDGLSSFDEVIACKMYLEDHTVFGGSGDLFANFGLEVDDTMKLKIQQNHIVELLDGDLPEIGDLIQFEFNNDIFEITFVEDEEIFYISGAQTTYTLSVKRFVYSGEILDTNDAGIDILANETITITTTTSNNGDYVIESITANKLVLSGADIVDESGGTAAITKSITSLVLTDAIFLAADNSINSVLTDFSTLDYSSPTSTADDSDQEYADVLDFSESNPFGENF